MKDKTKTKATFKDIKVRSIFNEDSGKKFVEGIIPYDSKSYPIWGMTEIISRTAFRKTLADGSNVRALQNHDENRILGSTDSGTLVLEQSDDGLICRCELPNTSYANDIYEIIDRGDCQTMSFGFSTVKDAHDYDNSTRTLKEVQLHEVSFCVPFPAYPETNSITYTRGFAKRKIDIGQLNETLDKDELNDSVRLIIKNTIDILSDIAGIEAVEREPETATPDEVGTSTENSEGILLEIEAEIAA